MGSGREKRCGGPIMLGSNLIFSQLVRQIVPRDHLISSSTPKDPQMLSLSLSLYVSLSSLIDEEIEREIYWWVTLNNRDRISQTVQLLRRRRTIEDRIGVGEKDNYKCRARGWQLRSHKLTMQCNPRLRRSAISVGLFFTSWSNWAGPRENFTLHTHVPSKVHTL